MGRQGPRQSPGAAGSSHVDDGVREVLGLRDKDAPVMLEIALIRVDGGTQPRAKLDEKVIREYCADMKEGAKFPPVDVFYDGVDYWLTDGFHRVNAAVEANRREIETTIHQGTRRDAVLFSVGVNAEHGLRRTAEDKRRSVLLLLKDAEWGGWGDREIARQCKVSHGYVGKMRTTYDKLDSESSLSQDRKYIRGKRETQMRTGKIRRANVERKQDKPATTRYVNDEFSQDQGDQEDYLVYDDLAPAPSGGKPEDPVQAELARLREMRQADPPPPMTPRGGQALPPAAQPSGVGSALVLAVTLQTALADATKSLERIATLRADQRLAKLPVDRKTALRDEVEALGQMLGPAYDHLAAIHELLNGDLGGDVE